ncbi:hypothetical protein CIK05_11045 [Bdellovibrio sp. qaytius]|nr:hypothetical protein CIK05_11045 [Bdellovibrio sp. qaytius]
MMKLLTSLVLFVILSSGIQSIANEAAHKHDESKEHAENKKHDDHHESEKNEHGDHKEEAEVNAQVGADKGILEADKEKGFKLSPEAEKNFQINKIKIVTSTSIELPLTAIATSTVEVNVYRFREGFYKRIDFIQLSKNQNKIFIKSPELKVGDEVAVSGLGYLRVTEIAAFDGAPEGHSH